MTDEKADTYWSPSSLASSVRGKTGLEKCYYSSIRNRQYWRENPPKPVRSASRLNELQGYKWQSCLPLPSCHISIAISSSLMVAGQLHHFISNTLGYIHFDVSSRATFRAVYEHPTAAMLPQRYFEGTSTFQALAWFGWYPYSNRRTENNRFSTSGRWTLLP